MDCLLVVDFQQGFALNTNPALSSKIKLLVDLFTDVSYCAFTQFKNTTSSNFVKQYGWNKLSTEEEQDFIVHPNSANFVLEKGTYSAVCDDLLDFLEGHQVKTVYLCGLDSDACVLATAFDLFDRDYRVLVIEDACDSSGGSKINDAAMAIMRRSFGKNNIVKTDEVIGEKLT